MITLKYRMGVQFARNKISRESINKYHHLLSTLPQTKKHYTGLVGRRLCFQFDDPSQIKLFSQMLSSILEEGTYEIT